MLDLVGKLQATGETDKLSLLDPPMTVLLRETANLPRPEMLTTLYFKTIRFCVAKKYT